MKNLFLIAILIVTFISCNDNDTIDENITYDFSYSISYLADSTEVEVCFSDACNNLPGGSDFEWEILGFDAFSSNDYYCRFFHDNGNYAIVMKVITPDFVIHSVSKEFEIKGIKK